MQVELLHYPSPIEKDIEKAIQDRLLNGFRNWNKGYEAWETWCDTLYEPNAHYTVHGRRLSLAEYKAEMKTLLAEYDIEVGNFENMLIREDWCAIRYHGRSIHKQTGNIQEYQVMEFVRFVQNPEPIGVRVIEGWAQ